MFLSYRCQTLTLYILTMRTFSETLLSLFSLCLKLCVTFLSNFLLFLSLWSFLFALISVSNLALLSAQQGRSILLWLGRNCENCQTPVHPCLHTWKTSELNKKKLLALKCACTNAPTDLPHVPVIHKVFKLLSQKIDILETGSCTNISSTIKSRLSFCNSELLNYIFLFQYIQRLTSVVPTMYNLIKLVWKCPATIILMWISESCVAL